MVGGPAARGMGGRYVLCMSPVGRTGSGLHVGLVGSPVTRCTDKCVSRAIFVKTSLALDRIAGRLTPALSAGLDL